MKPVSKGKYQKKPKQQPYMKLKNNLLFKEVYPEKFMWGVLVSTLLTSFLMSIFYHRRHQYALTCFSLTNTGLHYLLTFHRFNRPNCFMKAD